MGGLSAKQKIVVAAILAAFCGLAAYILFPTGSFPSPNGNNTRRVANDTSREASADPDKDGLTNIEELQIGTNPQNPDTDGDGFLDGEEVAKETYPTDPQSFPASGKKDGSGLAQTNPQSGNFSRDFTGAMLSDIAQNDRLFYTESTSTGDAKLHLSYDAESIENLANALVNGFLQSPDVASVRPSDEDLHIAREDSQKSLAEYEDGLVHIITDKATTETLASFYEKLQMDAVSGGGSISPALREIARTSAVPALANMEKRLRGLAVPARMKEIHKDAIAIVSGQRLAVSMLAENTNDPVRPLYALSMLAKTGDEWAEWKEKAVEAIKS